MCPADPRGFSLLVRWCSCPLKLQSVRNRDTLIVKVKGSGMGPGLASGDDVAKTVVSKAEKAKLKVKGPQVSGACWACLDAVGRGWEAEDPLSNGWGGEGWGWLAAVSVRPSVLATVL